MATKRGRRQIRFQRQRREANKNWKRISQLRFSICEIERPLETARARGAGTPHVFVSRLVRAHAELRRLERS